MRAVERMADSGRLNTRFVCPDCACWVYNLPRGGVVRVRAGTLDDTSWLRPTRHIWTRSKQSWVTFGEGDETFEGQPPSELVWRMAVAATQVSWRIGLAICPGCLDD